MFTLEIASILCLLCIVNGAVVKRALTNCIAVQNPLYQNWCDSYGTQDLCVPALVGNFCEWNGNPNNFCQAYNPQFQTWCDSYNTEFLCQPKHVDGYCSWTGPVTPPITCQQSSVNCGYGFRLKGSVICFDALGDCNFGTCCKERTSCRFKDVTCPFGNKINSNKCNESKGQDCVLKCCLAPPALP